jgi:hypothetical protein
MSEIIAQSKVRFKKGDKKGEIAWVDCDDAQKLVESGNAVFAWDSLEDYTKRVK